MTRSCWRRLGSPPRVREPLTQFSWRSLLKGITPACAGTTSGFCSPHRLHRDHPRVCGNHSSALPLFAMRGGSPPRVREPQSPARMFWYGSGITPACAGTTFRTDCVSGTNEDHPRVCGNHAQLAIRTWMTSGSPPRVREPLLLRVQGGQQYRITPACAGTTCTGL